METDFTNDECEKIESMLSEISIELNHVIKVYHEYMKKQRNLRMYIKYLQRNYSKKLKKKEHKTD